ncbi:SDR family oxidoreductase [Conyzicola sp.]|uniref:SDR family oxidoreductase n=1 Tax=Conyzicola sp. TaxID=1969404 RepID=UPI0039893381
MTKDIYTPKNPIDLYPGPPFPKQQQANPGTAPAMDPKPDHGEESYIGHGRLAGRKALVTGADSGIGRAVAIAFAREGADVALSYLPVEEPEGDSTASWVEKAGQKAVQLPGDLSDEQTSIDVVNKAAEELGGLDILVMVAGEMPTVDSIDDFDTETFDHLVRLNLHNMFWMTKAAKPHFAPGAAIITTSSVQGFHPSPALVEYAVTKAGIANFVRGMAQQLAEHGIRVNGVAPGPFWTPLQPSSVPNEKIEVFGEETPYGRPGQPAEIASTYVYLASQEASYTSGETIVVSGGEPLH